MEQGVAGRAEWMPSQEWLEQHKGVIGRSSFYEGVRRGDIPHIKVGRKILVRADALDVMYERKAGEK